LASALEALVLSARWRSREHLLKGMDLDSFKNSVYGIRIVLSDLLDFFQ
jgi:hypothetical protein